jgi:flagellar biosynthesis/type III secretory pathway protein FliH
MRNKLNDEEKKVKVSITVNPDLVKIITKNYKNKSKYIEKLIYRDLLLNKLINEEFDL